jgi:hypothetical protein
MDPLSFYVFMRRRTPPALLRGAPPQFDPQNKVLKQGEIVQ